MDGPHAYTLSKSKTSFAIDKHSYMQFRLNNFAYSKWASYRRDKASLTNKGLTFFWHIIVDKHINEQS